MLLTELDSFDLEDHGPKPVTTDGEASNPGPGAFRSHRRGGRSAAAQERDAVGSQSETAF